MSVQDNAEYEKIVPQNVDFFNKLSVDQPAVSSELVKKIPKWIEDVDTFSGRDGLGKAIVSNLEYISSEETDEFVKSVTDEVKKIRRSNPSKEIMFIMWSKESMSGKYFYDRVLDGLTEEERNKVGVIIPPDVNDNAGGGDLPIYFHLDDAANSGQQLMQSVNAMRALSDQIERRTFLKEKIKNSLGLNKVDFRIRLMRVTDSVLDEIFNPNYGSVKYMDKSVNVDISGNSKANKKMKTMDDVFKLLGISEKDTQNSHYFLTSHHERRPATLGIFRHKFQDNMPMVLVEGRVKPGFEPLFSREMMDKFVSPYPHGI